MKLKNILTSKNINIFAWATLIVVVFASIFIRSPFGFFDEQVHYVRSIGISNGQLLGYSKESDNSKFGHDIDKSNEEYVNVYQGSGIEPVSLDWLNDIRGTNKDSSDDEYVLNTSAAPYMPVSYFPYAIAASLAHLFNFDMRSELILMRLFGAITALGIVFAAFKLSPKKYKWTILAIALIPMCISAFAAITTDGFTIAVSLLFMATILRMVERIQEKELNNKDIAILAVASLLVVAAKMPTFLIIALILGVIIVFWKKINKKQKIYLFSIIGISAIITLLWAWYVKDINTGAYWSRNTDTMEQLKFIISHPVMFTKNLIYSMLNYDFSNIIYNLYANNSFYTSLPFVVDIVILIGVALSSFVGIQQPKPTKNQIKIYWVQVILFLIASIAIFTLLYLQFTPVGTLNKIDGVQPRYFLPFIPLLVMIPYVFKLSKYWRVFTYIAPFIGVSVYLIYIIMQLI